MISATRLSSVALVGMALFLTGCVHAIRDTQGFAVVDSARYDAPLDETWQATKAVLRDQDLDIATRDKRGLFVARTPMTRHRFVPQRTQYTITLEALSDRSTQVKVETLKQVFGVTLLTYYGWHDRKAEDNAQALAILDAIEQRVAATPAPS